MPHGLGEIEVIIIPSLDGRTLRPREVEGPAQDWLARSASSGAAFQLRVPYCVPCAEAASCGPVSLSAAHPEENLGVAFSGVS